MIIEQSFVQMIPLETALSNSATLASPFPRNDETMDGLFRRVADDDCVAFEKIFKNFYKSLCSYSKQMVACPHLAEEIVDDVFCNLWRNRKKIQIGTSFRAYLITSIRNRSLDSIRKQKGVRIYVLDHALAIESDQSVGCDGLIYEELRLQIDAAIQQLPKQCQIIFRMSREQDLSYKDIAVKLNISVKTVDTQIGRALKHIRKTIAAIE